MKKIFLIVFFMLVIVSVLSVLSHNKVFACSCGEASIEERFQYSSVVFTGTLVSKDAEGGNIFRADKTWKGELSDGYVYSGGAMCEAVFEKGNKYLVYTFNHEGNEKTDICSGNKLISDASTDINALNRLIEPEWKSHFPLVMLFGFVLTILIIVLKVKRRKKNRN